jgi:hypothetical protein
MILYVKIAIAVAIILAAYWKGYSDEHERFLKFQAEVAAVGKAQEQANQHAIEVAEIITESVKENYETRIASIKSEYARRMRQPNTCGGNLSAIPKPPSIVAGSADDPAITELCALETAKLIELQNWVKKQSEARK